MPRTIGRKPIGDEPMVTVHLSIRPDQREWLFSHQNASELVRDLIDAAMPDVEEEGAK